MIRGIGVDILEVERMRRAIEKWDADFLSRVFTQKEIEYCNSKSDKYQHFAARFAAKEAVSKALATGWSGGFRWKDVEIGNEPSGKPTVTVHGHVKNLLAGCEIVLSLSHTKSSVVAFAVVDQRSG